MADAMSINVSTQELRDTAAKIRNRKETLKAKLEDIKQKMNNLKQTWTSEASEEIVSKMNGMQSRFDQYDAVIESYAKFLVSAAEQYETTETTAKTNASQFQ